MFCHRNPTTGLTAAQTKVVQLVANGFTNNEIARFLFLAEATVKFHVANALTTTESRNRVELARWWIMRVEFPRYVEAERNLDLAA